MISRDKGGTMTIDYEKAWDRLRGEVSLLTKEGVFAIPPTVILTYMDFIEDILQWESKEEK